LLLAVGTWSFQVWLRAHPPTRLYLISFALGAVYWLFGLVMFIITWIWKTAREQGTAIFALLSKLTAAWSRRPHPSRTADKYLVYLRPPSPAVHRVVASRFEIHEGYLVFVDSEGKLDALFVMELVESFNVVSG